MKLDITVSTNDNCSITIKDNTKYWTNPGTAKGEFKYSDSISIDVINLNKISENVVKDYKITPHKSQEEDILIPIKFDGWFTVKHIVLPNKEWFDREVSNSTSSNLGLYSIVYYADEETIYKYLDGESYAIPLEELLEVNPVNTTISITSQDYISICFLTKCYINLCQQIFESRGLTQCQNKNNIDSELVYKRDIAQMAINVIKYIVECNNQLYEAERIIELMYSCNGICNNIKSKNYDRGCGCS